MLKKLRKTKSNGGFDKLAKKITKEYIKKGYSKEEAEEIGQKTAGKVYWQRLAKGK